MRLRNWIARATPASFLAAATSLGPCAVRVAVATCDDTPTTNGLS